MEKLMLYAHRLLKDCADKDFETVFENLKHYTDETTVNLKNNPVVKHVEFLSSKSLKTVIVDYAVFVGEAIHMLLDGQIKVYAWGDLHKEIGHNIEEEQGLFTKRIPHLEMMRQGFREELHVEVDNRNASSPTAVFIKNLYKVFRTTDKPYVAGALLAFEGVAKNEFYVLEKVVNMFLQKQHKELNSGLVQDYIVGHQKFEISHEEDLKLAVKKYIDKENIHNFMRGYLSVVLLEHHWWNSQYHRLASKDLLEGRL